MKITNLPLHKLIIKQQGEKPINLSPKFKSDSLPYLSIESIETDEIKLYADWYSTTHANENDIFVVRTGGRNGLVLKGKKGALGSTLFCLTPLWVNSDYLYYFLKLNEFKFSGLRDLHRNFWDISIPVVSLNQQQKIVNKIRETLIFFETQNKEIDSQLIQSFKSLITTTSNVLENIQNLVSFKKAVLKLGLDGQLFINRSNLNSNRKRLKSLEFCELITSGSTPKVFSKNPQDIPFLKVYNLQNDGIDFENKTQYISYQIHDSTLRKSKTFPDDVLMNIVGPPMGKVAIVPEYLSEININQAIATFRVRKDLVIPKYFYYLLLEGSPISDILSELKGNAGQLNISLTQCRNLSFDIPEIPAQKEIVKNIDNIFSIAEKINQNYEEEKKRQEELKKAVLYNLFENLQADINSSEVLSFIEKSHKQKSLEIIQLRLKQKKIQSTLFRFGDMKKIQRDNAKIIIKEIIEKDYNLNHVLTEIEINSIQEKLKLRSADFDYDDFSAIFIEMAQDAIEGEKAPFFTSLIHEDKLAYKINNYETSAS